MAIMSAIEHSELFRCVISIAAVTDPRETPGGVVVNAGASGARDTFNAASPLRRVDELNAPMLMFHGRFDLEFRMTEHTLTLANALERAGKNFAFIEYPQATDKIGRGPDRIDMLARIRGFLAEHIGPPLTEEESAGEGFGWRPEPEQE
jgi:dipeptidyl aminopeptidase/acylaminoacyl peptidase